MIDYLSYPRASLVRVKRTYDSNVSLGVPQPLLSRYYRAANPNTGEAEWRLDPASRQWDELIPYIDATKLYGDPPHLKPASALAAELEADRRRVARERYWAAVKALPGGTDPLWRYGSQSAEDTDDMRFALWDYSQPNRKPWFPRVRLRMKYGTSSLTEYAAKNGLTYPG